MTTNALMELADRLAALPKISESGRNDDGVEGVAIPGVDCYDFDDLMQEAAAQLRTAAAEGGEVKPFGWLATYQNGEKELIYSLPTDPDYEDIPSRVQPLYVHPPTDSDGDR